MFKCCKLIPVLIGGIVIQSKCESIELCRKTWSTVSISFFSLEEKTFNRYDVAAACCMSTGLIFFTLADSKVQPNFNSYGTICCLNNILWETHRNCSILRCADHLSGSCCWCCHWQLSGENHESASCAECGNSKAKQSWTRMINSLAIRLGILQFYIRIFDGIVWPRDIQQFILQHFVLESGQTSSRSFIIHTD